MDTAQIMQIEQVAPLESMLHEQLLDRQQRLRDAQFDNAPDDDVTRLLSEVDSALQRIDTGTFGICEECQDAIEPESVLADPLIRLCLGDVTQKELDAIQRDLQ